MFDKMPDQNEASSVDNEGFLALVLHATCSIICHRRCSRFFNCSSMMVCTNYILLQLFLASYFSKTTPKMEAYNLRSSYHESAGVVVRSLLYLVDVWPAKTRPERYHMVVCDGAIGEPGGMMASKDADCPVCM